MTKVKGKEKTVTELIKKERVSARDKLIAFTAHVLELKLEVAGMGLTGEAKHRNDLLAIHKRLDELANKMIESL